MLDSAGKLGLAGGLFNRDLVAFGNFEECVDIDVPEMPFVIDLPINTTSNISLEITLPAFKGQYLLNRIAFGGGSADHKNKSTALMHHLRHTDYGLDFGTNNTNIEDVLLVHKSSVM